jgi:hypothetical protein
MQRILAMAVALMAVPLEIAVAQPTEPPAPDSVRKDEPHRRIALQRKDQGTIPIWHDVKSARKGLGLLGAGRQELVGELVACNVPHDTAAIEVASFGLLGRWRGIVVIDERYKGCRGVVEPRFPVGR